MSSSSELWLKSNVFDVRALSSSVGQTSGLKLKPNALAPYFSAQTITHSYPKAQSDHPPLTTALEGVACTMYIQTGPSTSKMLLIKDEKMGTICLLKNFFTTTWEKATTASTINLSAKLHEQLLWTANLYFGNVLSIIEKYHTRPVMHSLSTVTPSTPSPWAQFWGLLSHSTY